MKLPQNIEGVYREGRTDSFGCVVDSGVEPLWFKSALKKTWRGIKKVAKVVKPFACAGCNFIPNPAAQIACRIACKL